MSVDRTVMAPDVPTPTIIGVDLDNTIISYDELIYRCAMDLHLIPAGTRRHKKTMRDIMRRQPDGERKWEQLQAYIYGEGIIGAKPFEGVLEFLMECRRHHIQTYIVSHKTEYCDSDGKRINLRDAAMHWLACNGIFNREHLGFEESRVFFESTRDAKIERIRAIECTHFIDDLEEVFIHPAFPTTVRRILFDPNTEADRAGEIRVFSSWESIKGYFFERRQKRDGICECP